MRSQRTRSQEKILKTLIHLGRPISAQELYVELRNQENPLGLATVYRGLDSLKLAGVIQARPLPSGETVYSPLQADQHHLTCLQCGATLPLDACPVQELENQLRESENFAIFYHTLEFFGLCSFCQAKQPELPE